MKRCCMCDAEGCGPTRASYLATGQRWHEGRQRLVIFRGNVCEMHFVEAVRHCTCCKVLPDQENTQ